MNLSKWYTRPFLLLLCVVAGAWTHGSPNQSALSGTWLPLLLAPSVFSIILYKPSHQLPSKKWHIFALNILQTTVAVVMALAAGAIIVIESAGRTMLDPGELLLFLTYVLLATIFIRLVEIRRSQFEALIEDTYAEDAYS